MCAVIHRDVLLLWERGGAPPSLSATTRKPPYAYGTVYDVSDECVETSSCKLLIAEALVFVCIPVAGMAAAIAALSHQFVTR